jgi:hypothetical protein
MPQTQGSSETIDGIEYTVFMLPPRVARTMLVEMAKVLAPVLTSIAPGGSVKDLLGANIDLGTIATGLTDRLSPQMLDDHMNKLASATQVKEGGDLSKIFDIHFRGEIGRMFKWYIFALKVNFGNFTSALESVSSSLQSIPNPKA